MPFGRHSGAMTAWCELALVALLALIGACLVCKIKAIGRQSKLPSTQKQRSMRRARQGARRVATVEEDEDDDEEEDDEEDEEQNEKPAPTRSTGKKRANTKSRRGPS